MRIKNFRKLIPVSFQLAAESATEIALVNLEDGIVYVWHNASRRHIHASSDLSQSVLSQFDSSSIANTPQLPSEIINQATEVCRETLAKQEAAQARTIR